MSTLSPDETPNPAAEQVLRRVRMMMVVSGAITLIVLAAILGVIGYRLFSHDGTAGAPPATNVDLPQGARIVSTAATEDRIVITIEVGGQLEVRTFDARTLKPAGRLNFAPR